jgi:glyceraldehyde-3-phosphate dehydrogenase (NADP+)
MQGMILDSTKKGARVINKNGGASYYSLMRPAVLYPCTVDMAVCRLEQFGPIVPVVPCDDISEVYAWMADSGYGQQASVWGPPDAVKPVMDVIESFVQTVNDGLICKRHDDLPFGGKFHSGLISSEDAFREFTRVVVATSKTGATIG